MTLRAICSNPSAQQDAENPAALFRARNTSVFMRANIAPWSNGLMPGAR